MISLGTLTFLPGQGAKCVSLEKVLHVAGSGHSWPLWVQSITACGGRGRGGDRGGIIKHNTENNQQTQNLVSTHLAAATIRRLY